MHGLSQRALFAHDVPRPAVPASIAPGLPRAATSLKDLVAAEFKFRTIYADPPWDYDNRASRGAARNHYRTMTLDQIRAERVSDLADREAHLHLWTTNGFLREAIDLIGDWGFDYKSCFVWVKPELGCGNYWRDSHEFLLFGVRGNLPFDDHCQRSWLETSRMEHSRKAGRHSDADRNSQSAAVFRDVRPS